MLLKPTKEKENKDEVPLLMILKMLLKLTKQKNKIRVRYFL